jgi:hypothetical protein
MIAVPRSSDRGHEPTGSAGAACSRRHGRQIHAVVLGVTLALHLGPVSSRFGSPLSTPTGRGPRTSYEEAAAAATAAAGGRPARLFAAGVIEPVLLSGYRLNELREGGKGRDGG